MYDEETRLNEENKLTKPTLVKILFVLSLLSCFFLLFFIYYVLTNKGANISAFENTIYAYRTFWLLQILLYAISIAGAFFLFAMKKISLYFYITSFFLNLVIRVYISLKGYQMNTRGYSVVGEILGWLITVLILVYIFRLNQKKLLK